MGMDIDSCRFLPARVRGNSGRLGVEMGSPEERLVRAYLDAYYRHDADGTTSFFTEDCLYEDIALGTVINGPERIRKALQGNRRHRSELAHRQRL